MTGGPLFIFGQKLKGRNQLVGILHISCTSSFIFGIQLDTSHMLPLTPHWFWDPMFQGQFEFVGGGGGVFIPLGQL